MVKSITWQRDSACHCGKGLSAFLWDPQILTSVNPKATNLLTWNFVKLIILVRSQNMQEIIAIGYEVAPPTHVWNNSSVCFFICWFLRHARRCDTLNGSIDAVWCWEVLLEVISISQHSFFLGWGGCKYDPKPIKCDVQEWVSGHWTYSQLKQLKLAGKGVWWW